MNRINLYTKIKFVTILSMVLFQSCNGQHIDKKLVEKYSEGADSVRRVKGLPIVKDNVRVESMMANCFSEYEPRIDCITLESWDKKKLPRLERKEVYYDASGLCYEDNIVLGPSDEILRIVYVFKESIVRSNSLFLLRLKGQSAKELTEVEAKSLLNNWQLR